MSKQLLVLAVVAFAAFAGCSSKPPGGTLAPGETALALDGSSDVEYTAFNSGGNPTGVIPMAGNSTQCAQDPAPALPPGVMKCTQAKTTVHAHFMALPTPDADGYKLFLAGGTTAVKEMEVGAVMPDAANMWDVNKTYPQDLEKHFQSVELRMGAFVVAIAPALQSGTEKFSVPKALGELQASGSYKGKEINVTVSGLPANGTFVGRLYSQDPKTCLLAVQETFPVTNGATKFTTKINVAQYAEFHIHVGSSLVTLYKTKVDAKAPACKPAAA